MTQKQAIRIHPDDNVAVALATLRAGTAIEIGGQTVVLTTDVPAGHKLALTDLNAYSQVIKYGEPIGHTLRHIDRGSLIDHNNISTNLTGTLKYNSITIGHGPLPASESSASFSGYIRSDGKVGIRNELWVIPTVGCVNGIVRSIVARFKAEKGDHPQGIDAVVPFTHNYGCSQLGDDHENTRRILRNMVHHPNAGGILVIGLGCENNQPRDFEEFCGDYDHQRVRFMTSQEVEGDEVEYGLSLLYELYATAATYHRSQQPLSALRIGLKCGGSDGFSGITANPLLGSFSDWLCTGHGGTTVLTEVPEMFGAEMMLMRRAASTDVLNKIIDLINDFKNYFLSHGYPIGENPSPGNKAGGISTLEEKALGCTQKSGNAAVCGVLQYGERLASSAYGLYLLSAPGNDLVATTALAAAGCQLILFTTGRGTPFATFVPTLKVSTNTALYTHKPHWIDFNAGTLIEGETMQSLSQRFIATILDVVEGRKSTVSEKNQYAEMAIFKNGITL